MPNGENEHCKPDREFWNALTWMGKMVHNFPAWHANRLGHPTQWFDGTNWLDEAKTIPEYMLVNIEHPQRIKPGCTVQPVEIIFREGGNAGSIKTA